MDNFLNRHSPEAKPDFPIWQNKFLIPEVVAEVGELGAVPSLTNGGSTVLAGNQAQFLGSQPYNGKKIRISCRHAQLDDSPAPGGAVCCPGAQQSGCRSQR